MNTRRDLLADSPLYKTFMWGNGREYIKRKVATHLEIFQKCFEICIPKDPGKIGGVAIPAILCTRAELSYDHMCEHR